MADQIPYIRVFISSPGDVNDERKIALEVIEQLPYQPVFRDKVAFRIVAWDKPGAGTSMRVTMTPQDAINRGLPKPSECDIVIVIFWSRMGTPYIDAVGKSFESGTHWELMDAIQGERSQNQTIIYRRTEKRRFLPEEKAEIEQVERLEAFFKSDLFYDGERITRGVNQYEKPDNFRQQFEIHFQELVLEVLKTHPLDNPTPTESPDNANVTTIEAEEWNPERSPFPGLRAFTEADADIFFGRGTETDALVEQVRDNRFVAVIASSGSGKSSLVGAGLIPRLRNNSIEGSQDWRIARFTPSDNPFDGLYDAMLTAFPQFKPNPMQAHGIKQNFINDVRQTPQALLDICAMGLQDAPEWAEVLLFIDQFEELFTLTNPNDVQAFLDVLESITESQRIRVVVTMRSDFYQKAVEYPLLASLLRGGSFPLAIPKRDALRQMIESPAKRAGIQFEDNLIDKILDDVGDEPGNLALMAYALDELYMMDDDGILTLSEYKLLGGVQGAIGARAENIWKLLDLDHLILHQVFLRLIEVDERGTATRRRAIFHARAESNDVLKLINEFTRARLLITDHDDVTNTATVEVAHEAILREWNTLRDWIDERQADFRVIARIRRDAQWWEQNGKREQDLPRAEQIDEFHQACKNLGIQLDNKNESILLEFIEDERDRLIKSLASEYIDKAKYDFVVYRLQQIDGNQAQVIKAILSNSQVEEELRIQIVSTIDITKKNEAIEALTIATHDKNPEIRLIAVNTLSKIEDDKAVEALTMMVNDENSEIRHTTVNALSKIGDDRVAEAIIFAAQDKNPEIRRMAVATLSKLDNKYIINPLILRLKDTDSQIRLMAVEKLINLQSQEVLAPLVSLLNDQNRSIRSILTNYLNQLDEGQLVEPYIIALKDNDIKVREIAAMNLGKFGDERAVEPLIIALDDQNYDIRHPVITALQKLKDKRAVKALINKLNDEDMNVYLHAVEALESLKDERAVEPLISKLDDTRPKACCRVIKALGILGYRRAVEPLITKLDDEDEDVRRHAVNALGYLGYEGVVEPLIAKLNSEHSEVRYYIIDVLRQIGDKRAVEPLIAKLYDEDNETRQRIVTALQRLGDKRAVEPLIAKLYDEDNKTRQNTVVALQRLGDKRAVEPLIAKLNDKNENVRLKVVEALGKFGDKNAVESLILRLNDKNPLVREHTVIALQELNDVRAIEPLVDKLDDENFDVRQRVVNTLKILKNVSAIEPLIKRLNDSRYEIRLYAVEILMDLGDRQAVEPLITMLNDSNSFVRQKVVEALGTLGDHRAVEPLIENLGAVKNNVDSSIIIALGQIGDKRAIDPLQFMYENQRQSPLRSLVLETIRDLRRN